MQESYDEYEKRERKIALRMEECAKNAKKEASEKILVICKDVAFVSALILFFIKEFIIIWLFDGITLLHIINCVEAVFWICIYGFIIGVKSDF